MSRYVLWLACLLGVWVSSAGAAASEISDAPLQMYTEDVPPLNYLDGNRISGYSTAVAQRMLDLAGLHGDFHLYPWKRAEAIVQQVPDTVLYTTTRTEDREQQFQWVGPLAPRRIYLYRLSQRADIKLNRLADAQHYSVVGLHESAAAIDLSQQLPDINLLLIHDEQQSVQMLLVGHADLAIMLDWAMQYHLASLHVDANSVTPALLLDDRYQYYFAVSKTTPAATVAKLQTAFDQMKASGELARLQEQYLHVKY